MKRIVAVFLSLFLVFVNLSSVSASLPVEEADLMPGGAAYEINPDGQGGLWISDWGNGADLNGQVWWVNSNSGATYIYTIPGLPTDARRSGNYFWWVDGNSGTIGRAELGADAETSVNYRTWITSPTSVGLYGAVLDASGRLWATDTVMADFYRLTPGQSGGQDELCTYTLPNNGMAGYLAYKGSYLWIADYYNSVLYRLDVSTNAYSSWLLPSLSSPTGMQVDAEGDLWYSDYYLSVIAELDPDWAPSQDRLTSYSIGGTLTALMVALEGERIWFTGDNSAMIGMLNPTLAIPAYATLTTSQGSLTPTCTTEITTATGTAAKTSASVTFATQPDYPLDSLGIGLQIYQIPPDTTPPIPLDSAPWGIAYENNKVWVVDTGRQKLIRFDPPADIIPNYVFLPVIRR